MTSAFIDEEENEDVMRREMKTKIGLGRLIFAAMLSCLTLFAGADVLVLKNGDRISGTVDSISGGVVLVATDYAGNIPVVVDAIAELVTDRPLNVATSAGLVSGKFVTANGQTAIETSSGTQSVELAGVQRASHDNLSMASLDAEWNSRADLTAVISNGNSDTRNLNTLIESSYKKDTVEHFLSLLISNEEAEEETTKDQLDLDYLYKRFLNEKWYASGNAEYFQDKLKDIDARITLGAGVGHQFWDDSFGAFSTDIGISAVYEDTPTSSETNPAVRWGLDYNRWLLQKKLEFFHKQAVLFIIDSDSGEVLSSSTGLRYAMNDRIDTVARVDVIHETEPSPGNSKTDITYTLGIGIKF